MQDTRQGPRVGFVRAERMREVYNSLKLSLLNQFDAAMNFFEQQLPLESDCGSWRLGELKIFSNFPDFFGSEVRTVLRGLPLQTGHAGSPDPGKWEPQVCTVSHCAERRSYSLLGNKY